MVYPPDSLVRGILYFVTPAEHLLVPMKRIYYYYSSSASLKPGERRVMPIIFAMTV